MKNATKRLVSALTIALFAAACENPLDTMSEMKDTTKDMSGTTQEMRTITENMYVSLRQQASEETRALKWKTLLDPKTNKSLAVKEAKVLFMSFEFQVWYGKADARGLHQRENRIYSALEELYMSVSAVHEKLIDDPLFGSSRMSKMSPIDLDDEDKNLERFFYALSATMHAKNDFQEETLIPENKKIGIEVEEVSLYDVIARALRKEYYGGHMSEAEAYVTIYSNRNMTIDLLNARINMLIALALKEVTESDDMTIKEKARGLLFKGSGGRLGSLQVDNLFLERNDDTRNEALKRLEHAVKTKALLEEIEEPVVIQKDIKSVLENLPVADDASLDYSSLTESREKKSDHKRFKDLRRNLLQSNP